MVSVRAVAIFGDKLDSVSPCIFPFLVGSYRISSLVLLRVHTCASCTIGSHGVVSIFAEMKRLFLFVPMHAFHHLGSD